MLTDDYDVGTEKMKVSDASGSDLEMNLDLPGGIKKKKMAMRVYESSEASANDSDSNSSESDSESNAESQSISQSHSLDSSLQDSELDDSNSNINSQVSVSYSHSQHRKKKKKSKKEKKKKYLSNEFIINSDIDGFDEPDQFSSESSESESDISDDCDESESTGSVRKRSTKSKKTPKKRKLKDNEFVKASGEDFKTTLKFVGADSESETESESEKDFESESEADDESGAINGNNIHKNNRKHKHTAVKKPKESLKSVLKESEALLRRQEPVSLPIDVINPRSLNLVLNEALATSSGGGSSSKAPKEAIRHVIEEKRRIQRAKLEKILGKERMAELVKDNPTIGQNKLDESIEVIETIEDEKAPADENGSAGIVVERVKVKLVDLPDKHLNFEKQKGTRNEVVAGYRVHLQSQKKSSIELLNEQLKSRISAQSDTLIMHKQQVRAAQLTAQRVKTEAREHARRMREVQRERELKAKKERKCEGAGLFSESKKKYEGIERRPNAITESADNPMDEEYQFINFKQQANVKAKVIVSSDSDDETRCSESESEFSVNDLLNLDNNSENESSETSDLEDGHVDELPEMNDAMSALLSGKFPEEEQEPEKVAYVADINSASKANNPVIPVNSVPKRKQSEFIDDEASDEDEEMDREDYDADEEAMELDMRKSKFIAESSGDEEDNDPYNTIQFINEADKRKDEEITNRLMAKLGKHMIAEEEELLDNLGKRYGIIQNERKQGNFISQSSRISAGVDEDIQKLLDPIEQKKRKLAALGSWNILQRQRTIEAADEEFRFKDEQPGGGGNKSGVKGTTTYTSTHHRNDYAAASSSDYYASETETDLDSEDSESENEYYEAIESGLQSKIEAYKDSEMLDGGEEMEVNAVVSLGDHLMSMEENERSTRDTRDTETRTDTLRDTDSTVNENTSVSINSNINNNNSANTTKPLRSAGVTVPMANAKLKSRLMALQQENDDNEDNGISEKKGVFKGFTYKD